MILAGRIVLPDDIRGVLFDMDGVLLDTLSMDVELVNRLIATHVGLDITAPRSVIRESFPYPVAEFWRRVLLAIGLDVPDDQLQKLVLAHEEERRTIAAPVHAGIVEILDAAKASGLKIGVVSNNPTADVEDVLEIAGIRPHFDVVVGNDIEDIAPKPAPDPYLLGARLLGLPPETCAAVEDSLVGAQAACRAGCHTIAVATGADDFADLEASGFAAVVHPHFDLPRPPLDRVKPQVRAGEPYVPDWLGVDRSGYLRLDRNECTQPPSELVAEALVEHIRRHGVHSYPDADRLAGPLAEYTGTSPDGIVVTNGSDQGIDLALRTFLSAGDRMAVARPEFPVFGHIAQLIGAQVDGVPFEDDFGFPYQRLWKAAAERPELIVIINPNNPTGTAVETEFIAALAATYPDTPVLVDEAYYEFTGVTAAGLLASRPNLVILRTFSKAFAMAGLRLGYLIAHPDIAAEIRKLRNPFDVNELAVVAAGAQLRDLDSVRQNVSLIMEKSKPATLEFFRRHNVSVTPGAANFMLVRPDDGPAAVAALRDAGVLVRSMTAPALAGMFRMSVGTPEEMSAFMDAYRTHVLGR